MITEQIIGTQSIIPRYIALTKPRIIILLVFTALSGMFLAAEGTPDFLLLLSVMVGGALAAGGANALNHSMDSDIDSMMHRTQSRPVASGEIDSRHAILFGVALNILAFALLSFYVNLLSAMLTLSATLFYVFVYTKILKRSTHQNIVIGGAAGAIPPLVGWTAVSGSIGLPALYMFAIVFFWTPPHFWALALTLKDDYARANIPMLPVVVGIKDTKKTIFLYTILVFALTLMFFATGAVGWIYLGLAIPLSMGFVLYAWRLMKGPGVDNAKSTFIYSMVFLVFIFLAIIIDSLITL